MNAYDARLTADAVRHVRSCPDPEGCAICQRREQALREEAAHQLEVRRARDYDDGIIADDDH